MQIRGCSLFQHLRQACRNESNHKEQNTCAEKGLATEEDALKTNIFQIIYGISHFTQHLTHVQSFVPIITFFNIRRLLFTLTENHPENKTGCFLHGTKRSRSQTRSGIYTSFNQSRENLFSLYEK